MICVPGRAGVATMRVAGPEGKPDPAPQLAAPLGQQSRNLELRGVSRAVIHCAVVPGIDVPTEEDEPILLIAGQITGQRWNHRPRQIRLGNEPHRYRTGVEKLLQALTCVEIDADRWHIR